MLIYDNEYETKENKNWNKDKIKLQHTQKPYNSIVSLFFDFNIQAFPTAPKVHVTVQHGTLDQKKDAMNIWIQSISRGQFDGESRTFDGPHSNLKVVCHNFRINEFNMQA